MMSMKHIIKKQHRRTSLPSHSETDKIRGTTNFSSRIRIHSIPIPGRWTSRRIQGTQRKKQISIMKVDGGITKIRVSPLDLGRTAEAKACVKGTSLKRRKPNLHNMLGIAISIAVLKATIQTRQIMRHPTTEAKVNGTDLTQITISTASPNHNMRQCRKKISSHIKHQLRIMTGRRQRSLTNSIMIIINLIQKKHHLD